MPVYMVTSDGTANRLVMYTVYKVFIIGYTHTRNHEQVDVYV